MNSRLSGDRRVPTPRFNLPTDLWEAIPSTVSSVSLGNTVSGHLREAFSLSRQPISLRGLTERSLAHLISQVTTLAFSTANNALNELSTYLLGRIPTYNYPVSDSILTDPYRQTLYPVELQIGNAITNFPPPAALII